MYKRLCVLMILPTIFCLFPSVYAMGSRPAEQAGINKAGVSMEVALTPTQNYQTKMRDAGDSDVNKFLAEIKKTVQYVLDGKEDGFTKDKQGIMYLSKQYDLNKKSSYLIISLVIRKYDPLNYVVRMGMDGLEGWLWERNLKNEISAFRKLSPGHYDESFSIESLYASSYDIKVLGGQKFKCFDASGRYIVDRIYSTFANNYVFDFIFAVGTDADDLSKYLMLDRDKQYIFVGDSLVYINILEKAIGEINWK